MRKSIAIAVLVLVAGGLVALLRPSNPDRDAASTSATASDAEVVETPTTPVAPPAMPLIHTAGDASPATPSTVAAPTDDSTTAPSIDMVEELDRAARSGDGRAACQMAAEISRCQQVGMLERFQRDERSEIESLSRDVVAEAEIERRIDELVRKEQLLGAAAARCTVFQHEGLLTPARYHVLAANAGHIPSMLASIHPMQMSAAALIRDPGLVDDFRLHAGERFRRVLESGDLRLVSAWLAATRLPETSPLLDQLPPEWRDPAIIAAIVEQLTEAQRRGLPGIDAFGRAPPIDAAQRAAGEALYRRYFADSPAPPLRIAPGSDGIGILRSMLSRDDLACEEAPTR